MGMCSEWEVVVGIAWESEAKGQLRKPNSPFGMLCCNKRNTKQKWVALKHISGGWESQVPLGPGQMGPAFSQQCLFISSYAVEGVFESLGFLWGHY